MYKAGCRGCDSPEFTRDLCADCWGKAESVDVEMYETLVEGYRIQMYPDTLNPMSTATIVSGGKGNEKVNENGEGNGVQIVEGVEDVIMGDGKVAHVRNEDSDDDSPLSKRVK